MNSDPRYIFEYKLKWMPGVEVVVHSDLRDHAKDWCKNNLERWQYQIKEWTHPYAFTYRFEHQKLADKFSKEFASWVDKGID